jgi:hypothetical protein
MPVVFESKYIIVNPEYVKLRAVVPAGVVGGSVTIIATGDCAIAEGGRTPTVAQTSMMIKTPTASPELPAITDLRRKLMVRGVNNHIKNKHLEVKFNAF